MMAGPIQAALSALVTSGGLELSPKAAAILETDAFVTHVLRMIQFVDPVMLANQTSRYLVATKIVDAYRLPFPYGKLHMKPNIHLEHVQRAELLLASIGSKPETPKEGTKRLRAQLWSI
jgi:hypothetical protein